MIWSRMSWRFRSRRGLLSDLGGVGETAFQGGLLKEVLYL